MQFENLLNWCEKATKATKKWLPLLCRFWNPLCGLPFLFPALIFPENWILPGKWLSGLEAINGRFAASEAILGSLVVFRTAIVIKSTASRLIFCLLRNKNFVIFFFNMFIICFCSGRILIQFKTGLQFVNFRKHLNCCSRC